MRHLPLIALLFITAGLVCWLWPGETSPADEGLQQRAPIVEEERGSLAREFLEPDPVRSEAQGPEQEGLSAPDPVDEVADTPDRVSVLIRLIDAETQVPLPDHRLEARPRFERPSTITEGTTSASGEFALGLEPGEYIVLQRFSESAPQLDPIEITPYRFEVPKSVAGGTHSVVLLGSRPPAFLDVEVVLIAGTPVEGAFVSFDSQSEIRPFLDGRARTDANGRARLGVWDPTGFSDGRLRAWDDMGNVSEHRTIESPFVPGLRRLVLREGAAISVHVRDRERHAVVGRRVLLRSALAARFVLNEDTDETGMHRFSGLSPGEYTVGVRVSQSTGFTFQSTTVTFGDERTIEFELPEHSSTPAVRGRVVDAEGQAIEGETVVIHPEGGWEHKVQTNADGVFEAWFPPCDSMTVRANLWAEGDVYEPDSIAVPHGTLDVVFTRVRRALRRRFEVEVYDLVSGAELTEFSATIDRGAGTEEWSNSYAARRTFELPVLEETRWRIASHGYIVRELQLGTELDALEEGARLRVGLAPGLDHVVFVRDVDTSEPLEGVLLLSAEGAAFRTQADGSVRLRADRWSNFRVTKEGYGPEDWEPDDYVLWDWGPLLLSREER